MIKNEELQIIVLRHKKNLLREYFRRFFVLMINIAFKLTDLVVNIYQALPPNLQF